MIQDQEIQNPEDEAAQLLRSIETLGDQAADQMVRLREAMRLSISGQPGAALEAARRVAVVRAELDAMHQRARDAGLRRQDIVVPFDDRAIQALGRDGVAYLARKGSLTSTDVSTAMTYRFLYENAGKGAGLGSQLEDKPKAIRSTSHGAVAAGLFRAYIGVHLTRIDQAVMASDRTGRRLSYVRSVAGEGQTIRSLGLGGRAREQAVVILREGLGVVAYELHDVKRRLFMK
ncbi:hypothetical protein [Caulobacter vibrioides]|uniref:hypothetical protein n=1 Tax=Caulobacter vibrioides TaxID=155892 RepID=UPI000BB50919|nr:hypothetical protein [Caulobacter vibrioides]ATC25199.1 hypothetical protein CA608_12005 [Caulobacter vibrioides]PLR13969.1 hypothetical protein CVUC_05305 [Caulobacter vibrioides]